MHTFQVAKYEFVLSSEPRAPPSRRRFKKSRGGCAACKKRKVKCDEEHPVCYNCSVHYRGTRACEWPETSRASRAESSRSVPSTTHIISKEPVSIESGSQREVNVSASVGVSTSICRDIASALVDPFAAFPQTPIPKAQELLHHYITVAAWEYFPSSHGPRPTNPYLQAFAATDPLLFHSNLQVSARSLERRQGAKWTIYTDAVARECVRLLRERVQDPVLGISNHTLGAIARMMEVEHDRGNTKAVKMHLDGIISIVKLRGGLDALRRSCTLTMMAVIWRTLLVTSRCPFVPLPKDNIEDPAWLRNILSGTSNSSEFPSVEDLGIDKTTWHGLLTVKSHSKTIEKTLKAGKDPDFTTTESLAGLLWQQYEYLPLVPGVEPLCDATRLATILFLCISNQNCRSFLFNHPSGLRSCKGITGHFRASLEALISLDMVYHLDNSSRGIDALSFILWLFMIGVINSCELPDRQWFVDGLVPLVNRMGIGSWADMKKYFKRIMWVDVWHDGVGKNVWEEVARKTREERTMISFI